MKLDKRTIVSGVAAGLMVLSGVAFAETTTAPAPGGHGKAWRENHPRQSEVLKRTRNERKRINADYKAGKITKAQRDQMLAETKNVRQEDRADAKANGGYITKDQQHVMNKQENGINQEIRSDVKQDAGTTNAPPTTTTGQ